MNIIKSNIEIIPEIIIETKKMENFNHIPIDFIRRNNNFFSNLNLKKFLIKMKSYTLVQIENDLKNKISTILDKEILSIEKILHRMHNDNKKLERLHIEGVFKNMVNKGELLIGTKLTHEKVLAYFQRKKILRFINENPGLTLFDISTELDISPFKTIWHLTLLQKYHFIKSKIEKKDEKYYPNRKMEGVQ
ncbi:MAG: winged helix-turn-helix transcriptional regulator [Candidatus Lokiarchaeota archaeon]|nr:winged helix-turn-helix transcriptional regulator [Candidatus Lokiarchaeota archaeon]